MRPRGRLSLGILGAAVALLAVWLVFGNGSGGSGTVAPHRHLPTAQTQTTPLVRDGDGASASLVGGAKVKVTTGGGFNATSSAGSFGLKPLGVGREKLAPTAAGALNVKAGRSHEDLGAIGAWYRSTPAGLEQGFTVAKRPGGGGALRIAMRASGDLTPSLSSPASLSLAELSGHPSSLGYSGLKVTDAQGDPVPAHFSLRGSGLRSSSPTPVPPIH